MSDNSPLYLVILAAGKGTRMKSNKAKVLHEVFYAPMVHHVLHATTALQAAQTIVIVGHQRELVENSLSDFPIESVVQEEQLGTGHAVLCAESAIKQMEGCVMILCGDTPLIQSATLQEMFAQHLSKNSTLTVMTTTLDNPTHYGRIISDNEGTVLSIVEEKDADYAQKKIQEINAGIYCIDTSFLFSHLKNIDTDNSQGEVYLTDIVSQAVSETLPVHKFVNPNSQDILGVNSRLELSRAHHELQMRRNVALMAEGVTMIGPETIQISPDSTLAKDVTIHPGVEISGYSTISSDCDIQAGAIMHNVTLGERCTINPYCCLTNCEIPDNSTIKPYSYKC
ncbi:bifunctional N-acetylglucosamine-1-phosphate uridyltransferase/glucosamine-1-phosphate acetyltransferase [Desulfocapsa sp. AH-315-G09]|uniref:Bifunctional N-acetylglucosamine-1-phosphate uridyltransferase/glucosamine-1-phosphate acetyltransferase n=1 Tax=Desulfotalea psychrophila TaxID=84980 RepID=A0ABS3AXJ4_9BACT|nr:bifunctional N-acetylglucosamine-1-phosphate uridyltransferase/glucosamine-1-phosphate acetyltransferase [Desulfotalea psychrophila]MBN4065270.1 bifunctional N-acetylglucosamine-1-phosphate uridyltransferase/glucosamine-1-phosphate acetyltransferase [Desulfocapsa sp. AH-315-G09]MBN4068726.1 bifunctional N-acetylglucosamine-1-phosphate uridyltransferase/glucosamine-1-phosphate acetyltransferase [Desulfotalea psychrophila]